MPLSGKVQHSGETFRKAKLFFYICMLDMHWTLFFHFVYLFISHINKNWITLKTKPCSRTNIVSLLWPFCDPTWMFSILFPAQKLLSEQAPPTHKHQHFHPLQHLYSSENQNQTHTNVHHHNQTLLVQAHISIYNQLKKKRAKQHSLLAAQPRSHNTHSHNYTQHSHS